MDNSITIRDNRNNKEYTFPIIESTKGSSAANVSDFYNQSDMYLYDSSFNSIASCKSSISFIDGNKGILQYRGYDIEELVKENNYLSVSHLLLHGELPSEEELLKFDFEIRHRAYLPQQMERLFESFRYDAHPMAKMAAAISAMSSFYPEHVNVHSDKEFFIMANRLLAKMPTMAAFAHRYSIGVPPIYPDNELYYAENFLYMMRAYPNFKYKNTKNGQQQIKQSEIDALDAIFTLHAEHEQNASTSTVRMVASTMAHPYAAISAGVSALWGKSHGGANEMVTRQFLEIGDVSNVDNIAKAKDKNDPFRLMGFGHRVYKHYDPRAKILKKLKDELLEDLHFNDPFIDLANKIEEVALHDEYFVKRNLYPNVDFYSGFILRALKIPLNMYTPIFVIGRTVGWLSQLIELRKDENLRISRPRQIYIGK